jgi:hypothetical protein
MVVNRLQKGLINLRIAPRVSRPNCQNITNSNRDFYYEKNNVSQVQLTYQKFKKKKKIKNATIVYAETTFCAIPHVIICHLFFQLTEFGYYSVTQCILIGSRSVLVICFQKWIIFYLFFNFEVILVIHCCFQNKILYRNY